MKLIIGLGNPGIKYKSTRHNVGFMFLDYFKEKHDFSDFKYESKFRANTSEGIIAGKKTILVKPQTFMNLSGESIKKIVDFYKIKSSDWIVVFDDISLNFGKLRFRDKGSAGGHNGLKDIIRLFGKDFNRIKVGVGFNDKYDVSDWVLSKFNEEELIELESCIFGGACDLLEEKM